MAPLRQLIRIGGVYVGGGDPGGPPIDTFVSGLDGLGNVRATQPTIPTWDNTGHVGTLTPYAGPGAGGTLTISTPGTVYTGVDFGNTKVTVRAPDVGFDNCRWLVTDAPGDSFPTAQVDYRSSLNTGGGWMRRCTLDNTAQNVRGRTGIMGWNVRVERTRVRGFVDNLGFYVPGSPGAAGLPLGVTVLDTFLGEMAFMWATAGGIVHNKDQFSHNDCIQVQGGHSWRMINCTLIARYSTTVGTGTPNSGSDTGWPDLDYTQAQGEAARWQYVFQSGALDDPEVRGYALGGSISGIMINTSESKGYPVNAELAWVYGAGGAYWLNCGVRVDGTAGFGTITHLRVLRDQRGAAQNGTSSPTEVGILSGVPVTMTDAFNVVDDVDWASNGVAIIRRNT